MGYNCVILKINHCQMGGGVECPFFTFSPIPLDVTLVRCFKLMFTLLCRHTFSDEQVDYSVTLYTVQSGQNKVLELGADMSDVGTLPLQNDAETHNNASFFLMMFLLQDDQIRKRLALSVWS